jgi:hypothetical protein
MVDNSEEQEHYDARYIIVAYSLTGLGCDAALRLKTAADNTVHRGHAGRRYAINQAACVEEKRRRRIPPLRCCQGRPGSPVSTGLLVHYRRSAEEPSCPLCLGSPALQGFM